jgi:hypothetical protein
MKPPARFPIIFSLLLIFALAYSAAKAGAPPDHRIMVTAVSPESVTIEHIFNKKKETFTITSTTMIQVDDVVATIDKVKKGMKVEIYRVETSSGSDTPEIGELDVKTVVPVKK